MKQPIAGYHRDQHAAPDPRSAAAHAGCFSMALSAQLGEAGLTAQSIRTTATVSRSSRPSFGSTGVTPGNTLPGSPVAPKE